MSLKLIALVMSALAVPLIAADEKKPLRRAAAANAGLSGLASFEQVLTEEQRRQMREFIQQQGPDFRENFRQLAELRRELQEAALSGQVDEKLIKEKTEAIAKLEAEQLRVRTLALAKVAPSLTPEQRQKIKQINERIRAERPGLGAELRERDVPRQGDPAAPPPPEK